MISYLYITFTLTVVILDNFPCHELLMFFVICCFFFRPGNYTFCSRSPKCFHSKLCVLTILVAQMHLYQGFVSGKTECITVLINLECKLHEQLASGISRASKRWHVTFHGERFI